MTHIEGTHGEIAEEKALSEKREDLLKYLKEQFGEASRIPYDIVRFVEKQDSEAVERLKGRILNRYFKANGQVVLQHEIIEDINKEFGDLK